MGFSFVGSQYPLEIAGETYRLDLLFYLSKLRCFLVIDLKGGAFQPEYTGKMNFYLAAVDDLLRHPTDQPSIGLILCRTKKELVVEYALRGTTTPMGIAEFTHLLKLPDEDRRRSMIGVWNFFGSPMNPVRTRGNGWPWTVAI